MGNVCDENGLKAALGKHRTKASLYDEFQLNTIFKNKSKIERH